MSDSKALILRSGEVMRMTGLSATTLWRFRKAGNFPKPVKLGEKMVGWPKSEVEEWIAARMAERAAA